MSKFKRGILLPVAITLALGTTGLVGYGYFKHRGVQQAREQRVQVLVNRFKACPDLFRATGECFTPEKTASMRNEADAKRGERQWEKAGMLYAKLGMDNEAREMAAECAAEGNAPGRQKIIDELSEREEAARRVRMGR
jgi:hypothetical protein